MRKLILASLLVLTVLFVSCGIGQSDWIVENLSSYDLTVYYTEEPTKLYTLKTNSSITITRATEGSIYATNQPYSVERIYSYKYIKFTNKSLFNYHVRNLSSVYDIKLYYIDSEGNQVSLILPKSSDGKFGTICSFDSYQDKSDFLYYFVDSEANELVCEESYINFD